MRGVRFAALVIGAGVALAGLAAPVGARAQEADPLLHTTWSFGGVFGAYDKAAAQRGFLIYQQVCSACHSMKYMSFRNLAGIGLSAAQIKAVAAAVTVPGGINDQGKAFERPGLPSDTFKAPFENEQAARAAMGGALPPDQSVLEEARPGGASYIYSLMQGYADPPQGREDAERAVLQQVFSGASDCDAAAAGG